MACLLQLRRHRYVYVLAAVGPFDADAAVLDVLRAKADDFAPP
jgi:hypothetical protein